MPAATYGQFNPGGIDPWPIESELAKAATTSPLYAQQMLENYQQERQAASNVYGSELDTQHEFAKKQLENQLYEARMKTLPELIKQPGGAAFLQHGGLAGMTPADISANPEAWTGLVQAGDAANQALNIKNAGQGMQGMSNAGTAFSNVSQVVPTMNIPVGENVQVQRARIDAAAKLGAAAMHGGGRGAREPKIPIAIRGGTDDAGNPIVSNLSLPANLTDEQTQRYIEIARRRQEMANGPRTGITGAPPPDSPPGTAAGAGTGRRAVSSSLQPAPGAPVGGGAGVQPGSAYVTDSRIQNLSKQAFAALPEAARNDVRAGVRGTIMPVVKLTDGTLAFRGASGTIHRVPGAGGGNAAQ